jgi:hypothetical protein
MVHPRVLLPVLAIVVGVPVAARQNLPRAAQQRAVFQGGAHYVRVDAYPTGKDGRIVEGLTKDGFEILEDGTAQTIESADYVTFDTRTPDTEPRAAGRLRPALPSHQARVRHSLVAFRVR